MPEERRFEDLASDLSARFVNVSPEQVDHEIARALDLIRPFFQADFCSLLEVLPARRQFHVVHLSHAEELERLAAGMDICTRSSWLYHRLVDQGEPIVFSSCQSLPSEADVEKALWEKSGIHALFIHRCASGDMWGT